MYIRTMIYCLSVVVSFAALGAQDTRFVSDKKKITVSCSKLKEQALDELSDTLRALPALLRAIADIQEEVQEAVESYIMGKKGCFWDRASKEQLQVCCTNMKTCNEKLEILGKELANLSVYTKKLG